MENEEKCSGLSNYKFRRAYIPEWVRRYFIGSPNAVSIDPQDWFGFGRRWASCLFTNMDRPVQLCSVLSLSLSLLETFAYQNVHFIHKQ